MVHEDFRARQMWSGVQCAGDYKMRSLFLACLLFATSLAADEVPPPPPVLLANVLDEDVDLPQYWVSEKYDGIRAWWNGRELRTRNGHLIAAPAWFIAVLPNQVLDGELWTGRGEFENVARTVRDARPDETAWRRVRFMVFDLPDCPGTFDERLGALKSLRLSLPAVAVEQFRIADRAALDRKLADIVDAGGEGLMLHRGDSRYLAGRSDDLLKLKPYQDAEARVVGYIEGKGKYAGMLGALRVKRPDGVELRLGTGFTDEQRRHPPPRGATVTYSFTSLTAKGMPRFARFVRVRVEADSGPPIEDVPHRESAP